MSLITLSYMYSLCRSVSSQKIKILFNPNNATERLKKHIEAGKPVSLMHFSYIYLNFHSQKEIPQQLYLQQLQEPQLHFN